MYFMLLYSLGIQKQFLKETPILEYNSTVYGNKTIQES